MARQDILLTDENELQIANGDFAIDDANDQHVALLFDAIKGEIRNDPSLGFGAVRYLKSRVTDVELKRALRVELNKDGYNNAQIELNRESGKIQIVVD